MQFEWDEDKAAANLEKHGVDFVDARAVFRDEEVLISEDKRRIYGKPRFEALGLIDERLHVVIYTFRAETCRIISARKANKREQRRYGYRSNDA